MSAVTAGLSIWRRQGLPALFRHVRLVLLRRLHHIFWDRGFEAYEAVPTSGYVLTQHLEPVDQANIGRAREYLPSPRLIVTWLLHGLDEDLSQFTFVDFGSGRGRVLLAAAEMPFKAVRGIEFSTRLHEEAARNIAFYPPERLACGDIGSTCADVADFALPDGDCILYFFNPFDAELLSAVIARAVDTAHSRASRLIVILYNPVHREIADRHPMLQARPLPLACRTKMALLSPYRAAVYYLDKTGAAA